MAETFLVRSDLASGLDDQAWDYIQLVRPMVPPLDRALEASSTSFELQYACVQACRLAGLVLVQNSPP